MKYPEVLRDKLVEVIAAAQRAAVAGRAWSSRADEEDRLSFNRRFHLKDGTVRFNPGVLNPEIVRPAGPIDPDLPFLLFTKDRKPVGSLTVFALHADTVGGTAYSADYPGQLAAELRREFGDGFISVFGTGTCGDINHIDVSGRRRYNARLIGQQLAIDILSARSRLATGPARAGRGVHAICHCRCGTVSEEQAAHARRRTWPKSAPRTLPFLAQVETVTTLDLLHRGPTLDAEVQVIRLHRGRRHRPAARARCSSIWAWRSSAARRSSTRWSSSSRNDNPAYIPTEQAFKEGSYETVNSRIAPGGGERLVEAAIQLLKERRDSRFKRVASRSVTAVMQALERRSQFAGSPLLAVIAGAGRL